MAFTIKITPKYGGYYSLYLWCGYAINGSKYSTPNPDISFSYNSTFELILKNPDHLDQGILYMLCADRLITD
jgi:hypothetical protein